MQELGLLDLGVTGNERGEAAAAAGLVSITTATTNYDPDGKALRFTFNRETVQLGGNPVFTIKDEMGSTVATEADASDLYTELGDWIEILFSMNIVTVGTQVRTFTSNGESFTFLGSGTENFPAVTDFPITNTLP